MLLDSGQNVVGTYEVEKFLGSGAFAEVYRVKHRYLGRQAMKVFKAVGTQAETERLLEEAALLSRIGHDNIIRVFDANMTPTSDGVRGFFTMEYVAGGSLQKFWQSHAGRFVPTATSVDLIAQVCHGLSVAHAEDPPIIHRDIKLQNILVGYVGSGLRAKLGDFGLAKRVDPVTMMASAGGTLAFKPPEVFRKKRADSRAADVFALGTTLYVLLTDMLPYPGAEELPRKRHCYAQPPEPPSALLNRGIDTALDEIVLKALARDPDDRYPTAKELFEALAAWQSRTARIAETAAALTGSSAGSSEGAKYALGEPSLPDEGEARAMASEALGLSQHVGKLPEAADLMEEAFNKWPELRAKYEGLVRLWRNGIAG
jgi:serine/threonine-protein kinase